MLQSALFIVAQARLRVAESHLGLDQFAATRLLKLVWRCRRVLLIGSGLLAVVGCRQEPAPTIAPGQKMGQPSASAPATEKGGDALRSAAAPITLKLKVLVVDDAPLAAGLKLLRGEWAERNGGLLQVQEWTAEEMIAAQQLPADLLVYPSRYVGTLVDRKWLRPLRNSVLRSRDVALEDLLPLVRNVSLRYGNQIYAVSLGEPPLMLAVAGTESPLENVPSTWDTVKQPLSTENSPLAQPRAAELLARGIALGRHRSRLIDWFDIDSMQPQITNPPFQKALQQMLDSQHHSAQRKAAVLTLSWPGALPRESDQPADSSRDVAMPSVYVPLPPASQVFNPLQEIWEATAGGESLVCLGFAGRSASVTRTTRNSASAFRLLAWLISESIASQLSPRSQATVWSRQTQVTKAERWLAHAVGADTAAAVTRQLKSECYYLLPRIPGVDEYLQVMEDAIATAYLEGVSAEKTLRDISGEWNRLTEHYGRDRQREAYRRHLGMSDE